MRNISVVIPVWNEEKNIRPLVRKIDNTLRDYATNYEIIFVDDRSTDKSVRVIESLMQDYPIRLVKKQGNQGKAISLMEGFAAAKYSLLCMIDADLQYDPRHIPEMIRKIVLGSDMVIANRTSHDSGFLRKFMSNTFNLLFVRVLHGVKYDVQSGLKVFKKQLIQQFEIEPSPWTFDLELVLRTEKAGYKISPIDIAYKKRHAGESKIGAIKSSLEIGMYALTLKTKDLSIVPFTPKDTKAKGTGFIKNGNEYVPHTHLPLAESAFTRMNGRQYAILASLVTIIIFGMILNWHSTLVTLITIMTLIYFTDLLFNFFLVYRSYFREPEVVITDKAVEKVHEKEWPMYTILCPLYKEWEVLPQFTKAMSNLDYPKDKLQVMLLIEEDDKESQEKIYTMNLPYYFEIVIVPESRPKTKPKACNYGLTKAKGEYVVIYDAEDIPDPLQLKKAILAFKKAKRNVICLQAKLNFYNPSQNLLTRLFTIEYSLWFNLVLTGLQSIHAPIPLGGTSNHFRTRDIIRIEKWDPFNVTEDADLGMRLMKRGYQTAILNSTTMEEANSDPMNWLKQRSRWIKGYIQTYYVHMRQPQSLIRNGHIHNFIIFQLIIGTKILCMLINPIMWVMTIAYFGFGFYTADFIHSLYLTPIFYLGAFTMFIGNFLYMYYYMLGAAKREQWVLIPYAFLTPFYWLAMSVAATFAFWEFAFKPHYWHKTQHGLHLKADEEIINRETRKQPQIAAIPA